MARKKFNKNQILSIAEAARVFGVKRNRVTSVIKKYHLQPVATVLTYDLRCTWFRRDELAMFLDSAHLHARIS